MKWSFIPEHSPHFGGIWEAAVKSTKTHLKRIVGSVKLTYEELSTVLTQIEAVLNSRPLVPMVTQDGEGVEALTPGHFLIGKSLCSLPDKESPVQDISHLRRWQLCQRLTQHFWQRWSKEYLQSLRRFCKWHCPQRNLQPGDVVILQEDGIARSCWPIGRVEQVFPGDDGLVCTGPQREFTSVQSSRWYRLFFKMTKDIVFWPAECSFQKELVTQLHMLSELTIHYTTAHAQYSLYLVTVSCPRSQKVTLACSMF